MAESMQSRTKNNDVLGQEYLDLTKRQIASDEWTGQDRRRLLELKQLLNIDQPLTLTADQRSALHRQVIADTPLIMGGRPQPSLTKSEVGHILTVNVGILKSRRRK